MTPESKVKKDIKAWLEARNIWYFMPVQSGYGKRGIPDFIACWYGRLIGIEAKAEHGDCTAWQERCHHEIRKSGGIAIVAQAPLHLDALQETFRAFQR